MPDYVLEQSMCYSSYVEVLVYFSAVTFVLQNRVETSVINSKANALIVQRQQYINHLLEMENTFDNRKGHPM